MTFLSALIKGNISRKKNWTSLFLVAVIALLATACEGADPGPDALESATALSPTSTSAMAPESTSTDAGPTPETVPSPTATGPSGSESSLTATATTVPAVQPAPNSAGSPTATISPGSRLGTVIAGTAMASARNLPTATPGPAVAVLATAAPGATAVIVPAITATAFAARPAATPRPAEPTSTPEPRPGNAATYNVNSSIDTIDVNPGDGICSDTAGNCTLRAAVMESNAILSADTIVIPAGTYRLTIPRERYDSVTHGDLEIVDTLTIRGAGEGTTIIDGEAQDRIFEALIDSRVTISDMTITNGDTSGRGGGGAIQNSGTMTLTRLTVTGNTSSSGGAIYNPGTLEISESDVSGNFGQYGGAFNGYGTLTLINTTVTGNTARGNGGAFQVGGTLTIIGSTISNNSSSGWAGAIYQREGQLTIDSSVISGNTARTGAGILSNGTADITSSTISGHSGNAIYNDGGTVTLSNSTIFDNKAADGSIVNVIGGEIRIANSIIAGNSRGGDCSGIIVSLGHNLIGDRVGCTLLPATGDIIGTSNAPVAPSLGPLQDNGGPTATHALLQGSPAIGNGGGNSVPSKDQRGLSRPQCQARDIGAFEIQRTGNCFAVASNQTVSTPSDTPVTITLSGSDADAGDTLSFVLHSIPFWGVISHNGTDISKVPFTLTGNKLSYTPKAGYTGEDGFDFKINDGTADSGLASTTINVLALPVVTKTTDSNDGTCDSDCSLREAIAIASPGDAITLPAGTYTLDLGIELLIARKLTLSGAGADKTVIRAAELSGNATSRVFNVSAYGVVIENLTIQNGNGTNSGGRGGGVLVTGELNLKNVIVSGNRGGARGGGVYNDAGIVTILDSTITSNTALHGERDRDDGGGGLYNSGGLMTLTNVTVDNNSSGSQAGGIRNLGLLTLTDGSVDSNTSSGEGAGIFSDAGKATLTDSSVSNNAAVHEFFSNQTGGIYNIARLVLVRTVVSDNLGGGISNLGTLDITDSVISGNSSEYMSGISNRDGAITINNSTISNNTGGGGISNGDGTIDIIDSTISGNSSEQGRGSGINNNGDGTMTVVRSAVSDNEGTGVYNRGTMTIDESAVNRNTGSGITSYGTLTMTDSTVDSNSTPYDGGGITGGGVLIIDRSTISNNTAGTYGGGISNRDGMVLTNVTISGNTAVTTGGGISDGSSPQFSNSGAAVARPANGGEVPTPALTNVTIIGNAAESGGGIWNTRELRFVNTIVANNLAGGDCGGTLISLGHNLGGDGTCVFTESTDLLNRDPLLGALKDNGGPTLTHALLPGSSAIDGGTDASAPGVDQRGTTRPQCGASDVGAFEVKSSGNCPPVAFGQTVEADKSGPVTITLVAVDVDPGSSLRYIVVSLPGKGRLTDGGTTITSPLHRLTGNRVTYTPDAGSGGFDSFTFKVNDNSNDSNIATVVTTIPGSLSVTKTTDTNDGVCDSDCSLREAIIAANGRPGVDTIEIPAGTFAITIAGINEDKSNTGDIDITEDLIIHGSGVETTIIDGAEIDRVFHLIGSNISVDISDLTVRNGNAQGGVGGGINIAGGTLTLTRSNVSSETTRPERYQSLSGITNDGGTLTLNDSTVSMGAGITNSGTLTLTNSTISSNHSTGLSNSVGGVARIADSEFNRNFGWGIINSEGGSMNLVRTTLFSNSGGLANSGTVDLADSAIVENRGGSGGGINNSGEMTIVNSTITGNYGNSSAGGGGMFNRGTLDISFSTINSNITGGPGGGILNEGGELTVTDSTIDGNSGEDGAGISNSRGTARITNSTVSNNTTRKGGGGLHNLGTLTVTNVTVSGNSINTTRTSSSGINGGGIYNAFGITTILNSTINNNSAPFGAGGGLYSRMNESDPDSVALTISNTIISNSLSGGACSGSITSLGHNFDDDGSCGLGATTDVSGSDPSLGILKINGGTTETHALLQGSPAIDAGNDNLAPSTDQRGIARPQCAASDIGAYELETPASGNCLPNAYGQTVHTAQNTKVTVSLAGYDAESPGALGYIISSMPAKADLFDGATAITSAPYMLSGKSVTYSPRSGTGGIDSFNFRINDGTSDSNAATVIVVMPGPLAVTKTGDTNDGVCDSDCSLREAIIWAGILDGANTILLPAGIYSLSIAGLGEDSATTGDLDIDEDLVITGAGSATTIIDSGAIDRVFEIFETATVVDITGITIRNGSTDGDGGGMLSAAESLTLTDVTVSGSTAEISGGGIYHTGSLTMTDSTVSGNSANRGGGLSGAGTWSLSGLTISNNTANTGGGIYSSGEVTLTGSTIDGNTGISGGGGILNQRTLTISDSHITNNLGGDDRNGNGGGISNGGLLVIIESEISGNSSRSGGGIYSRGTLTLIDSTVSDNAANFGGGIYLYRRGTSEIVGTTISNNVGTGIYNDATLLATNTTISGNKKNSGTTQFSGDGVGIHNLNGNTTLVNVTIANNSGRVAGGIYSQNGTVTLTNVIVSGNLANEEQGGCSGDITSLGHNIEDGTSCEFSEPTDLSATDPLLGALQDNGGSTLTHALQSGSPAIDSGDGASCPATDQRGVTRPQGSACDTGSFESDS